MHLKSLNIYLTQPSLLLNSSAPSHLSQKQFKIPSNLRPCFHSFPSHIFLLLKYITYDSHVYNAQFSEF